MFLLCRKSDRGQINIICQGDCESFITHYIKYNLSDRDVSRYVVLEPKEIPISNFIKDEEMVPLEPKTE